MTAILSDYARQGSGLVRSMRLGIINQRKVLPMGYVIPDFDDEDLDAMDAWDFQVSIDGDDITITPPVRWASDESAGYAS